MYILNIGGSIIYLRKTKSWHQKELTKQLTTSVSVISRYEQNEIKPSIETAKNIADALEVSIDYLIGRTSLILDKETIHRIEDISKLKDENKKFIFNLIDMALRDMKTKKAYS